MPCQKRKYPSAGVYQASPAAPVLTSFRSSLRRPFRGGFAVLDRRQQTEKPLFIAGHALPSSTLPAKSTDALIAAAKALISSGCLYSRSSTTLKHSAASKTCLRWLGIRPPLCWSIVRWFKEKRHTETQEAATQQGFAVCPVVIYARAAHGDAGHVGQTAAEHEPKGKAAQEMAELYAYIAKR